MRRLHPGAWWLWALGLATAATWTTNPLLLLFVVAIAGAVVASRRDNAPWARSYAVFLRLGLVVLAIRVVFAVVFVAPVGGTTLVTLPSIGLPDWLAGIRIGGPVTVEGLHAALQEGMRLATVLVCLGAANALASPHRLLRAVPGALYEAGVAVVVAMTFAPQIVAHVSRVRAARRLRGRPDRGIRGLRGLAMPVLEGALERSLELAAAMDARGYGRMAAVPGRWRLLTAATTLAGLLGLCLGLYGLLDAGSATPFGLPLLGLGLAAATAGLILGGRRCPRTRYRPDRWSSREWAVAGSGIAAAAITVAVAGTWEGSGLRPELNALPGLPPLPAAALLVALVPAWAAPRPEDSSAAQDPTSPEATPELDGASRPEGAPR
jgi:energy-coupling factor transport system permease protein